MAKIRVDTDELRRNAKVISDASDNLNGARDQINATPNMVSGGDYYEELHARLENLAGAANGGISGLTGLLGGHVAELLMRATGFDGANQVTGGAISGIKRSYFDSQDNLILGPFYILGLLNLNKANLLFNLGGFRRSIWDWIWVRIHPNMGEVPDEKIILEKREIMKGAYYAGGQNQETHKNRKDPGITRSIRSTNKAYYDGEAIDLKTDDPTGRIFNIKDGRLIDVGTVDKNADGIPDDRNYGHFVLIEITEGPYKGTLIKYAHLREEPAYLKELLIESKEKGFCPIINAGQEIGTMGQSGTNNRHLHLEFQVKLPMDDNNNLIPQKSAPPNNLNIVEFLKNEGIDTRGLSDSN
jgi:hypothetical protein